MPIARYIRSPSFLLEVQVLSKVTIRKKHNPHKKVLSLCIGLALATSSAVAVASTTIATTPNDLFKQAAKLVNEQKYAASIPLLKRSLKIDPSNQKTLSLLVWSIHRAERHDQVTGYSGLLKPATTHPKLAYAIADSAHKSKQYNAAAKWYKVAVDRDYQHWDAIYGLANVQIDNRKYDDAEETLATIKARYGEDKHYYRTSAYLREAKGDYLGAVDLYDQFLSKYPEDEGMVRAKAFAAQKLGAHDIALNVVSTYPTYFNASEIEQIKADKAGTFIRWGKTTDEPEVQKFTHTDDALKLIDTQLRNKNLTPSVRKQLLNDRIVALVSRTRYREATRDFQAVHPDYQQAPTYVLKEIGKAYLSNKDPRTAKKAYREVLSRQPKDFDSKVGLFYSHVDLDETAESQQIAADLRKNYPEWRKLRGSRVVKESNERLTSELTYSLAHVFAEDLEAAQAQFEKILETAPNNTSARHELANVYRQRGWLQRAENEYSQVLSIEPTLVNARIGYAHTLFDQGKISQAKAISDKLYTQFPQNLLVKSLRKRIASYNRFKIEVAAETGENSVGNGNEGEKDNAFDIRVYSSPFNEMRTRAFVHLHNAKADFTTNDVKRSRLGAGISHRGVNWSAKAEVISDQEHSESGIAIEGGRDLTDTITVRGGVESLTAATPLKAENIGVTGERVWLEGQYRPNERIITGASLNNASFSDDNDRIGWSLSGDYQTLTNPRHKLWTGLAFYGSKNDNQDVIYFSPESDLKTEANLDYEWLTFREYDRLFIQQFNLKAGTYKQDGFDNENVWSFRYGHEWQLENGLSLRYGISRSRNVYDGAPEYNNKLNLNLAAPL